MSLTTAFSRPSIRLVAQPDIAAVRSTQPLLISLHSNRSRHNGRSCIQIVTKTADQGSHREPSCPANMGRWETASFRANAGG